VGGWYTITLSKTLAVLQRFGFVVTRQRGSHVILKNRISKEEEIGCVVPLDRELAIGTLRSILRQARITPEEFIENI
jgi:predicted RNA binding protein YcfA (HicA-like mRNA interferase family)